MQRFIGVIAVALFSAGAAFGQPCPDGEWCQYPANGHWYRLTATNPTWEANEEEAVAAGGHLVAIGNEAENAWVLTKFGIQNTGLAIGLYQLPGSDEPADGWVWTNGEPVVYTNWRICCPAEPNDQGGGEDVAYMHWPNHPDPGTWYDVASAVSRGIIEIEAPQYVDEVVEEVPGTRFYEDASHILGPPDWIIFHATGEFNGSPGEGGVFVFKFKQLVVKDGPGSDLRFWQGNAGVDGVCETSTVLLSEDGVAFVALPDLLNDCDHTGGDGSTDAEGFFFDFDIAATGLDAVQYVKVVDVLGNDDGSDIDAIEALNFNRCVDNVDCNDGNVCTQDECINGKCQHTGKIYGDVDNDGDVDLFDLFCILNCFSDLGPCTLKKCDLDPCDGNGMIDLFDLFAVLNAFSGVDPCCGGLP